MSVISSSSVVPYLHRARPIEEIGRALQVGSILEGSVTAKRGVLRVSVQLTDLAARRYIWAEAYERDTNGTLSTQGDLAIEICRALRGKLTKSEALLIGDRPTNVQSAYDLYLRAQVRSREAGVFVDRKIHEEAVALYEQAIAQDPNFGLAYAGLSLTHGRLYWVTTLDGSSNRRAKQQRALAEANRLVPFRPETQLARGAFLYYGGHDFKGALREFLNAEVRMPNDEELHGFLAYTYRRLGRWHDAVFHLQRSITLNPREGHAAMAETLMLMRRFQAARDAASLGLAHFPDDPRLQVLFARGQFELDHDRNARRSRFRAIAPGPEDPFGLQGAYEAALRDGELGVAAKVLADRRIKWIASPTLVGVEPVMLRRAWLAHLKGTPGRAAKYASAAVKAYHDQAWPRRQVPFAQIGLAQAYAFIGENGVALKKVRAVLAAAARRDLVDLALLLPMAARVFLALERDHGALDCLETMMSNPCLVTPMDIHEDPAWKRLRGLARFKQLLDSASII